MTTSITAALAAFDTWQETRNYSQNTIERRHTSLASFARAIQPLGIEQATHEDIDEWLSGYPSPATRHAYLSDVNVFYRWAVKRRILTANPADDVEPIRVPASLPRPVPTELIPHIIAAATDPRLELMLALAALAGLRVFEIAALRWEDVAIHTNEPHLIVRLGKGQKDRRVEISPWLEQIIARHERRPGPVLGGNRHWIGARIATHLRVQCGIPATAHQLRASFLTEFYRVSKDIVATKDAAGHEGTRTTLGYIGRDREIHRTTVVQMFPRPTDPEEQRAA